MKLKHLVLLGVFYQLNVNASEDEQRELFQQDDRPCAMYILGVLTGSSAYSIHSINKICSNLNSEVSSKEDMDKGILCRTLNLSEIILTVGSIGCFLSAVYLKCKNRRQRVQVEPENSDI